MNSLPPTTKRESSQQRWFWTVFWLLVTRSATAQNVLPSPPQSPAVPVVVQDEQNSSPMQVFAPSPTVTTLPLQWGPVRLHPHASYSFLYANGVQSSPGQQHDTIVQRVAPGIGADIGDHWTLDYTPSFNFYSSGGFRNTVDHSVRLGWGTSYNNWFFSGSQNFLLTSDPGVETASQSDQQIYNTSLGANYQFNDKMSLDMQAGQNLNYVSGSGSTTNLQQNLADSRSWSTLEWLNYQFWPRFNVGLGVGGGYTQQDGSPNAWNEQYQGRANWRATDKLSFQLSGGLFTQQYASGGAGELVSPIFSGSIQYQPFEQTRISLRASEAVSPSSFQNQSTKTTAATVVLDQRLLGVLFFDLTGGYTHLEYVSSITGLSTSRSDDIYTFNARLSCSILKHGTIGIFFGYSEDQSSQSGFAPGTSAFGYSSRQFGVDLGFSY